VAENGPEAIIPLHKSARSLGLLAATTAAMGGKAGSSGDRQITVQVSNVFHGVPKISEVESVVDRMTNSFIKKLRQSEKEDYRTAIA
jgi:hypothetical protein